MHITSNGNNQEIIRGFSGYLESYKLMAVLGNPKTTGKSTFLKYITGYLSEAALVVTGSVKINELSFDNPDSLKSISAFVIKEDILLENLTVYQTLVYQGY